jgi:hypothetical protein
MIQGLTTRDSRDFFLPDSNYPSWLAYTGEGPSVRFQVPEDSDHCIKGITLCVVYSSTISENMVTECLPSVLIINYTKFTIQIYKQDTVRSFNDEDWQGVVSNLGAGDNVEIFVAFGHGLIVKETTVYLIYDQPNAMEIEPSITKETEPSVDAKMELLQAEEVLLSPNVKTGTSPKVAVQASPNVKMEPSLIVKNEPLPRPNKKNFTRLAKRVGECLCMNQNSQ